MRQALEAHDGVSVRTHTARGLDRARRRELIPRDRSFWCACIGPTRACTSRTLANPRRGGVRRPRPAPAMRARFVICLSPTARAFMPTATGCSSADDADDALQDVASRLAWRRRFEGRSATSTWLHSIATNTPAHACGRSGGVCRRLLGGVRSRRGGRRAAPAGPGSSPIPRPLNRVEDVRGSAGEARWRGAPSVDWRSSPPSSTCPRDDAQR